MPPKKAQAAAAVSKKSAATPAHATYRDMIKDAILNLKERSGSSRQAIKKYVLANNSISSTPAAFDNLFNRALRSGVEAKEFAQPKGPSGPVKLVKKEGKPAAAAAKPAVKKTTATKPKKTATAAAPKKAATTKKAAAPKKTTTTKKATAAASEDKPKALTKTKTGRVTKPAAKPAAAKKAAAPKKKATATAKKASPKKKAAAS